MTTITVIDEPEDPAERALLVDELLALDVLLPG